MKLKNLEEALHKAPFMPFVIHIDGKDISVEHPDQVLFSHDRATVVVAPSDNRFHIIETDQIKFLTLSRRARSAKSQLVFNPYTQTAPQFAPDWKTLGIDAYGDLTKRLID